jgi:hypothetical protein
MSVLSNVSKAARPSIQMMPAKPPTFWAETHLQVEVRDDEIRKQVSGFDGLERVFALVVEGDGGSRNPYRWVRKDLAYTGDVNGADVHSFSGFLRPENAHKFGIAFGVETNQGTYWLQTPDQNFKP